MKQFSCGNVVPGCQAVFTAESEDELLGQVAGHAADEHAMTEIPDDVLADVRSKIVDVPG